MYNVPRTKSFPPLKIVDTPGFGDTRGIKYDEEITKKIKDFFDNKIGNTIHGVLFVLKSTDVRMTANQVYVFNEV